VDVTTCANKLELSIKWARTDLFPIRIAAVQMNSPAHVGRLCVGHDFIVGSFDDTFSDFDDFVEIVQSYSETRSRLDLLVYNDQTCCLRLVKLFPKRDANHQGLLGAEFASGLFHVPKKPSACIK